jgi:hypothetical protein
MTVKIADNTRRRRISRFSRNSSFSCSRFNIETDFTFGTADHWRMCGQ